MEDIAKSILNYLGNKHTKVEKKSGFMGNYYSHLIDTMFLAENFESREIPEELKGINKMAAEVITVCHECVHSVQSKWMHMLNTIFSNLALILSIICIAWGVFGIRPTWLLVLTCWALVVSITIRLILEIKAVNGSIKLSKELIENQIVKDISEEDIQQSINYMNKHKLSALFQMIIDKVVLLILVLVIR